MTRARDIATQGGSVLVATASPSAATSVNFLSCFTSAYDTYFFTWAGTTTSDTINITYQFLSGSTADATANYFYGTQYITNVGGPTRAYTGSATSGKFCEGGNVGGFGSMYLTNPFLAVTKRGTIHFQTMGDTNTTHTGFTSYNVATSFNGMRFAVATGTMTGTISIYGMRK